MTIGNDFTKSIRLDLFPGIHIPYGYYILMIDYSNKNGDYYNTSYPMTGNHYVTVGRDVYSLRVILTVPYGATTTGSFHKRYEMRIDQLILLNMVQKFLG